MGFRSLTTQKAQSEILFLVLIIYDVASEPGPCPVPGRPGEQATVGPGLGTPLFIREDEPQAKKLSPKLSRGHLICFPLTQNPPRASQCTWHKTQPSLVCYEVLPIPPTSTPPRWAAFCFPGAMSIPTAHPLFSSAQRAKNLMGGTDSLRAMSPEVT